MRPEHRNTYLGVIDRLKDIQATGATAVLLGNVFLSSTVIAVTGGNGSSSTTAGGPEVRRPLSFFAPDTRWGAGRGSAQHCGCNSCPCFSDVAVLPVVTPNFYRIPSLW